MREPCAIPLQISSPGDTKASAEEEKKEPHGNDEKCQQEKGRQPSPEFTIMRFF
jgi:hypothetical protein